MSQPEPQILALTVTGHQAAKLGTRSRKMFVGKDGSIGRAEDCDWVLSATGVSRTHAMVRYVNGIYFIEDRSTNGMLLNDAPLIKGDPAALKDGDRLRIDNFEIAVQLKEDSETIVQVAPRDPPSEPVPEPVAAPMPSAPLPAATSDDFLDFGLDVPAPPQEGPRAGGHGDSLIPDAGDAAGADLDPLNFLDAPLTPASESAEAPPPASWNHSSGIEDHFRPPMTDAQSEVGMLPDDWDLGPEDVVPAPSPIPAPPSPAPESPPAPSAQAGATRPTTSATSLPPEVDAILRIVVDGVMDVLRARAEIKNTFRLPMTIIQRSENNPLKFALGTDEALRKIMAPPDPAFLSGSAAFNDAFDDIRCHQMAMLAGVRAGFDALLKHFDPGRFEREGDTGGRYGFGGKGRHWERYREHYQSLSGDPDECFRRLFGDEFARAYEEQLARLKSARRAQHAKRG